MKILKHSSMSRDYRLLSVVPNNVRMHEAPPPTRLETVSAFRPVGYEADRNRLLPDKLRRIKRNHICDCPPLPDALGEGIGIVLSEK